MESIKIKPIVRTQSPADFGGYDYIRMVDKTMWNVDSFVSVEMDNDHVNLWKLADKDVERKCIPINEFLSDYLPRFKCKPVKV